MIPAPFGYVRAKSLEHAWDLLDRHGDEARLLAGGHSLLPMMKLRMSSPALLIDIGSLPELRGVGVTRDRLVIGSGATHAELEHDEALWRALPLFRQVASQIADPAVRNRGTIGGSLVNADPSADWPAAILALDATLELQSSRGHREVRARNFFLDMLSSDVASGEVLVRISVPLGPPVRTSYRKFRHPASGYAVAGAAVVLHRNGNSIASGSIAVTGVATRAFRAPADAEAMLTGEPGASRIPAVAAATMDGIEPMIDRFADREYRLHLGRTMVRRALADVVIG